MRGKAIQHRKREHDQRSGDHEQQAGGKPSATPVQLPADPDRQLLRFGPRKQMAEVEGVEILLLAGPPRCSTRSAKSG